MRPFAELSQSQLLQRVHVRPARLLVAAGELVILADHFGESLGDGEAFVLAVGHGIEEALADLLPIEWGSQACLFAVYEFGMRSEQLSKREKNREVSQLRWGSSWLEKPVAD